MSRENKKTVLAKAALEAGDESAVGVVSDLIQEALNVEASDIHLEPKKENLRVRLRVDGVLRDLPTYSSSLLPLVLSRVKIMAGMDIAEKRTPQDGNINLTINDRTVNIRASSMPTIFGEKIVLRLLSVERVVRPVDDLGFSSDNRDRYLSFLNNASGMILITGPTGCGKTTALYSTLSYINTPEKNIITVEDPVEYRLEDIVQIQVNNKINLSFANALRSVLRQDPDVIMVGEIRDNETAGIATRAALTGHLVFSTLHTNDAPRAVTRILDMEVEPYLLTSCLVGVVAQRLVRLNCPFCTETYKPPGEELAFYLQATGCKSLPDFKRGKGCPQCGHTGFKGRTAVHEVMPIDDTIRNIIRRSGDTEKIRHRAHSLGMTTLAGDGLQRAAEGLTTIKEVFARAYSTF